MKKSFQDPDPTPEERRRSVEKNILKHMGQLSEDNIYMKAGKRGFKAVNRF